MAETAALPTLHRIGHIPPHLLRADSLRLRLDLRDLAPLDLLDPSIRPADGAFLAALDWAGRAADPAIPAPRSSFADVVNDTSHRGHRLDVSLRHVGAIRAWLAEHMLPVPAAFDAVEALMGRAIALVDQARSEGGGHHKPAERDAAARRLQQVIGLAAEAEAGLKAAVKACNAPRFLCRTTARPGARHKQVAGFTFDPATGDLTFVRPADRHGPVEFLVALWGLQGGRPVEQQVSVTLTDVAPGADAPLTTRLTRDLFENQIETLYTPDPRTLILTGLDLTLEQSRLEAGFTSVTAHGYIVRIPHSLRGPGVALDIVARFVEFGDGVTVDVSALHGADNTAVPAKGDPSAKDAEKERRNGANGAKGGDGGQGGSIRIRAETIRGSPRLLANGGRGGRGQNGGDGADGVPGVNGLNGKVGIAASIYSAPPTTLATPGGPAQPGGDGGRAGRRGDHGDGGSVDVRSVAPFSLMDAQTVPGQCFLPPDAKEAVGGKGGKAAAGGKGGKQVYDSQGYAPDGKDGPAGQDGLGPDEAKLGQPGALAASGCSLAELCQALAGQEAATAKGYGNPDSALLSLLLFGAERLYLNADSAPSLQEAGEVLDFLIRVTADRSLMARLPKLAALYERSGFLRNNLAAGLDCFGKAPNAVPSLALARNETYLRGFLGATATMERDYDAIWDKDRAAKNWKEKIEQAVAQAKGAVDELNDKVARLAPAADQLMSTINLLRQQAAAQFATVENSRVAFQQQYEAWQQGQMLIGTLKMAWSIAMMGAGTASLFSLVLPAIGDSVGADKKPKPISFVHSLSGMPQDDAPADERKEAGKDETPKQPGVVAAFGKVKGGFKECWDAYQTHCTHDEWTADTLKIVPETLDREAFDREVDAMLEVPGASDLKAEVHKYLDIVRQRNEAIVAHDSTLLQLANTRAQIGLADRDAAAVSRELQEGLDPQRPIFVQYLRGALQLLKSYVVETLHDMRRSAAYYTLEPVPFSVTDHRTSMLELQHQKILRVLQKSEEQVGALNDRWFWLEIRDDDSLARIRSGRPVWFGVALNRNAPPSGPFARAQRPMVHRISCVLDGLVPLAPKPGLVATVSVMHAGVCGAYNDDRHKEMSFTFAPRTMAYQYDVASGEPVRTEHGEVSGDLTEGGKFIMLSPFGFWGVQIAPEDGRNSQLDLSAIACIRISFLAKAKTLGLEMLGHRAAIPSAATAPV